MYTYITHGSEYFMEQLVKKHANRNILEFKGQEDIVLYEETEEKTVFTSPESFGVVSAVGPISVDYPVMLRYFQVIDDKQKIAENKLKGIEADFNGYEGFRSYRLLKPEQGQNYCAVLQFDTIENLEDFKKSSVYRNYLSEEEMKAYQAADFMSNVNFTRFLYPIDAVIDEKEERNEF